MSGGGSHNHNHNSHNHSSTSNSNSSSHDGNDGTEGDDHQHLKVNDGSGGSQESSSSATSTTSSSTVPLLLKSPLSPKLPSRFKFSKHKSGSKSANANLRSKSGEGETAPLLLNENGGQPSTSSAANDQPLHSGFFSRSNEKASNKANSKAKSASAVANGSSRRPMLIRQQSDEHQQALQEKVRQQENGGPLSGAGKVAAKGKGDKTAGKTGSGKSVAVSGSKNVGKLRKMAALGSTTNSHQPSDIVYEEGDSNKVPSVVVCLMTV